MVDLAHLRIIEAVLFASAEPLDAARLREKLPLDTPLMPIIEALEAKYAQGGFCLKRVADKYAFCTAADLSSSLQDFVPRRRRLSKAALETLAIIAYHQPATRAEIEDIRGVSLSRGTLDVLLETGFVVIRGRRRVVGRPLTYGTSEAFLLHFGLGGLDDLPGLSELREAGLLDGHLPSDFEIPVPASVRALGVDEDPLAADDDGHEMWED